MDSWPLQADAGSFIPTTHTQTLQQQINTMNLILNTKVSGYYALSEFVNGAVWYPDPTLTSATAQSPTWRQEFQKVIVIGTLPAAASTLTIAHGLTVTSGYSFTHIYGTANDPSTTFIPLPYSSPVLADNIELWADTVNVYIKVGKDRSGFTDNRVILKFIKS
jgi:hypothetical protein